MQIINFYSKKKIEEPLSTRSRACSEASKWIKKFENQQESDPIF